MLSSDFHTRMVMNALESVVGYFHGGVFQVMPFYNGSAAFHAVRIIQENNVMQFFQTIKPFAQRLYWVVFTPAREHGILCRKRTLIINPFRPACVAMYTVLRLSTQWFGKPDMA